MAKALGLAPAPPSVLCATGHPACCGRWTVYSGNRSSGQGYRGRRSGVHRNTEPHVTLQTGHYQHLVLLLGSLSGCGALATTCSCLSSTTSYSGFALPPTSSWSTWASATCWCPSSRSPLLCVLPEERLGGGHSGLSGNGFSSNLFEDSFNHKCVCDVFWHLLLRWKSGMKTTHPF